MRVLLIHNDYGGFSGEEYIFENVRNLLLAKGHDVMEYRRSSREIAAKPFGRVRAFLQGIHSRTACGHIRRILQSSRPDVVHVQNVFPLISPSVLAVCRKAGVPVVMNVQNFRLGCPNGLMLSHGEICNRCVTGREYWCILRNCEHDLFKSAGYALRTATARISCGFSANVSAYMVPTEFHRQWLGGLGFVTDRIHIVPNMVDAVSGNIFSSDGGYVGFAGRIAKEKGIHVLLEAAKELPNVAFRIAGTSDGDAGIAANAPPNVAFLGHLTGDSLADFYESMRMLVVPSTWYEGFPTVIPQAMLRGKPIIASRIGGLPYIVQEGVTGRLFTMGDATDLARCIRSLWDNHEELSAMGVAAKKAAADFCQGRYYERLMNVFDFAIRNPLPCSRSPAPTLPPHD